jgi:hypothetical protein
LVAKTALADDVIRAKANEILARGDYDLGARTPDNAWLFDLLIEILSWALAPFEWLFRLIEGWPIELRFVVILALLVVLGLLIAHIIRSIVTAMQTSKDRGFLPGSAALDRETAAARFEQDAAAAQQRGDYITAVRLLFRAGVLRLEHAEKKSLRPGTTNRELLRRYRKQPSLVAALANLVDTIDRKWYGDEPCTAADCESCCAAHAAVSRLAREGLHVHGA